MPGASGHIVNSATFEVRLTRESEAFDSQARLADFFHQTFQPALDQALTAYACDGDYRMDRLVIDIGAIDIFHPDPTLSEKIRAIIAYALQRLERSSVVSVVPEVRLRRSFIVFIQTGQIPWDATVDTLLSLEKDIEELKQEEVEPLIEEIRSLLSRPAIRRRLLTQFSISFVQWLLEKLQPALPAAFSAAAGHRYQDLSPHEQLDILLQAAGRLPPGSSIKTATEAIREQLTDVKREQNGWGADEAVPASDEAAAPEAAAKGIFVSQAGVVLLHPFFIRFFDRRGLLTADHLFKSRDCREKAIHLLHFLATGQEHPEEQHTTVYKVMCGLDIHEPVAKNVDLADEDRDEAMRLLESAIEHWNRLKKTSPDGLRTSFLQRHGKLTQTCDGWRLTVEQQSIDILLRTLPWILSVIRLPWLKQPVQVDWA